MLQINSNGQASRDIVVIIDTTSELGEHLTAPLVDFVLSRLPRHHPAVFTYSSYGGFTDLHREYQYNVVFGTSTTYRRAPDGTSTYTHRVVVAIHLHHQFAIDDSPSLRMTNCDDTLVEDRDLFAANRPPLPADTVARCLAANCCGKDWLARTLRCRWPDISGDVMDVIVHHLDSYPEFVQDNVDRIGVSAISPSAMTVFWHDILHSRTNGHGYTHAGLGRGVHRMQCLDESLNHLYEANYEDALFCVEWRHELANEHHPARTKEQALEAMNDEAMPFAWKRRTEGSKHFNGKPWSDAQKRPIDAHALQL